MRNIDDYANNCTLVAVREISGRADQDVMDAFLKRGWKPGRGTYPHQYEGAAKDLGIELERVSTEIAGRDAYVMTKSTDWDGGRYKANSSYYMTAKQFAEAYPTGVYLVASNRHAFVIRDGVIVDPNLNNKRTRQRIVNARRVLNPATKSATTQLAEVNKDSVVRFATRTVRKTTSKSFRREASARVFAGGHSVRLGDLLQKTSYTIEDARWDVRKGVLVVE